MDGNGNGNKPGWIPFGTREWEEVHPEIAARILTEWKQKNPSQFGDYLKRAMELTRESKE